jgi:hypothetical protein
MAALKKTAETTAAAGPQLPGPQPKALSARIEVATVKSRPVDSGAQRLRLYLEAIFSAPQDDAALAEPVIEKWSRPVRMAIFVGTVVLPWSLLFVAGHALLNSPLFPWVY